jgi:hypothetical protein
MIPAAPQETVWEAGIEPGTDACQAGYINNAALECSFMSM